MSDFILLMHNDATEQDAGGDDPWGPYIQKLKASGCFEGGSAVGGGVCMNKGGKQVGLSSHIVGFITLQAETLERARELVIGNPVYEAGGTVEIRELPHS